MNHPTNYRTWNRCMYRVASLWPSNAVMCKIWTFSQCCVCWLLAGLVFLKSKISKIIFRIASMYGLCEQEMSDLGGGDMKGPSWIPRGPIMGPCSAPSDRCRRCEQRSVKPRLHRLVHSCFLYVIVGLKSSQAIPGLWFAVI
jgi:hypothetical protein